MGTEAFGEAVVSGKAPHSGDFLSPGVQGMAELDERREGRLPQFGDGAEQPGNEFPAGAGRPVFFQQQVTEAYGFRNFNNYRLRVKVLCY